MPQPCCSSYGSAMPKRSCGEPVEQVPVVVQRGVDVQRDPRHGSVPYGPMPKIRASKALPGDARGRPHGGRRLRRPGHARLAARSTGDRICAKFRRRADGQLRGLRRGRRRGSSRSCSCTGSAAAGRTGSRTSRAWRPRDGARSASTCRGSGSRRCPRTTISISGYGAVRERAAATSSTSVEAVFVGNSMGGFISAEVGIQFPERAARIVLVSAAGRHHLGPGDGRRARGRARGRPPWRRGRRAPPPPSGSCGGAT